MDVTAAKRAHRLGFCTYQNAPPSQRVRRSSVIHQNLCFAEAKERNQEKRAKNPSRKFAGFRTSMCILSQRRPQTCIRVLCRCFGGLWSSPGAMTAAGLTCSSYGGFAQVPLNTHTHTTNINSRDNRPSTYSGRAVRRESVDVCAYYVPGMCSGVRRSARHVLRRTTESLGRHVRKRTMESVGGCAYRVPGMYSGVRRRA